MQLTNEELKIARNQYSTQKRGCRSRVDKVGNLIKMRLTFDEWLNIWLTSGHWHERGNKRGQYVMSRNNDLGHYEIGNVEIKTNKENSIENNNSKEWKNANLIANQKLSDNPEWRENVKIAIQKALNKPISCDGVIYPSLTLAGEALAPSSVKCKRDWMGNQKRKYPDRFFYI